MPGRVENHASTVAASRSGSTSMMRRRSRSQTIVPYRCPRLPRPIIDAYDLRCRRQFTRLSVHRPQQRVLAHRKQKPPREALAWAAPQRKTEVVDDALQPCSAARKRYRYLIGESLRKYLPLATRTATSESSNFKVNPNATIVSRKIEQTPPAGRQQGSMVTTCTHGQALLNLEPPYNSTPQQLASCTEIASEPLLRAISQSVFRESDLKSIASSMRSGPRVRDTSGSRLESPRCAEPHLATDGASRKSSHS